MLSFLRGTLEIELTSASLERCLNRWTAAGLPFRDLHRISELTASCRIYESHLEKAQDMAEKNQCEVRILERRGLPKLLGRLKARPVLAIGIPLAICTAIYLNQFVWFIRIDGSERVPEREILHALAEEQVGFGMNWTELEPEFLKHRLLIRLPSLRWISVNQEGSILTVLAAEREPETEILKEEGVSNLVAVRSGIVRELRVISGFPMVEIGEPVKPGDILISGLMEWTTHIQATRAAGEVYASTFRSAELISPVSGLKKIYTGRTETCKTVIFQRKRRKITGNSGIFGGMCDRIVKREVWTIPGGYELPLEIETVTLLEYRLVPMTINREDAEARLNEESFRWIEGQMTAGKVETAASTIHTTQDSYLSSASFNCLELISRSEPAELFGEEEQNGEAH